MSIKRRLFTKEFKQQVIREVQAGKPVVQAGKPVVQAGKPVAQAAREHDLHPNLIGP